VVAGRSPMCVQMRENALGESSSQDAARVGVRETAITAASAGPSIGRIGEPSISSQATHTEIHKEHLLFPRECAPTTAPDWRAAVPGNRGRDKLKPVDRSRARLTGDLSNQIPVSGGKGI
jgi:hypothetical protein